MIGKSELVVSEQTLNEAVQQYLDRQMGAFAQRVVSVQQSMHNGYVVTPVTFSIKLDDKIPEAPTAPALTTSTGDVVSAG